MRVDGPGGAGRKPSGFPLALADYMLGKDLALPSGPYGMPLAYATLLDLVFHSHTALDSACYSIPGSSRQDCLSLYFPPFKVINKCEEFCI